MRVHGVCSCKKGITYCKNLNTEPEKQKKKYPEVYNKFPPCVMTEWHKGQIPPFNILGIFTI